MRNSDIKGKRLSLQEIKDTQLNILLEFDKLCREKGLTFYLCGGSLLGAVRHKGFIPWDDDIDICMARPQYNRLCELAKKDELGGPEWLKVVCYDNGTSRFPFIKVLDKRTVVYNDYFREEEYDNLWIDLLPVDGLPDDKEEVARLYRRVTTYRKYVQMKHVRPFQGKSLSKKLIKPILFVFANITNTDRYNDRLISESTAYPYEQAKNVGIITEGLYGVREAIPREAYEKWIEVEFEGHTFKACSYWNEYLHNLFGDYMQLPPEDKRKTHDMKAYRLTE